MGGCEVAPPGTIVMRQRADGGSGAERALSARESEGGSPCERERDDKEHMQPETLELIGVLSMGASSPLLRRP